MASEVMGYYLKDANRFPLLTKEQEVALALKIERGDRAAYEQFINSSLRLVVSIAKNYTDSGLPISDLVSAGNIGLMKAVEGFNPRKGFRFSTYGSYWIRQSILQDIYSGSRTIRIPVNKNELLPRIKKATDFLSDKNKRYPTAREISDYLKIPEDLVSSLISDHKVASLDSLGFMGKLDYSPHMQDRRENLEERTIREISRDEITGYLGSILTEKQADIIKRLFGFDGVGVESPDEIARRYHNSPQNISLTKIKAIKILKGHPELIGKIHDYIYR